MKVFVYRNLHKKCWSIRAMEGPDKGKVISHAFNAILTGCTLKVSEAGRQRVLAERRKNVHAGIVGEWIDGDDRGFIKGCQVSYNPYKMGSFVKKTGEPITEANAIQLSSDGSTFTGKVII